MNVVFLIKTNKTYETIDILNSNAIIHVFKDLFRFYFFESSSISYIQIGFLLIFIFDHESIKVSIIRPDQIEKMIRFYEITYCVNFVTNLITLRNGIVASHWDYVRDGTKKNEMKMKWYFFSYRYHFIFFRIILFFFHSNKSNFHFISKLW